VRTRVAALLTLATTLAAWAGTASVPVGAQVPTGDFAGYGSGATISANVLRLGETQALNIQAAAAGQSTRTPNLPDEGILNELDYIIQPPGLGDFNAYGRGTGLELGLLTQPAVDPNQILLSGLAEAAAPPPSDLVVKQIGPVALGGLAFANLLRGRAQAIFVDPNTCVIGRPFSFGEGEAAGLQLVGTPNPLTGELIAPLVGAALPPNSTDPRNVSRTRSVT
jgi:hypothetical protein